MSLNDLSLQYILSTNRETTEKEKVNFLKAIITILILLIIFLVSCTLFLQEQM